MSLQTVPKDEKRVFEMISAGDTTGLFQMESGGFRQLARELKPDRFEDISVMLALYRPGPMEMIPEYIARKHDPAKVTFPHPALEEVLGDTYGIIVYQEQCLQIANVMAGYSLGRGDLLRRAIGKKSKKLMAEEKDSFVQGAKEQGHTAQEAKDVFDFIEKFAVYGFNRAHTASYGLITYTTAYLKVLYPYEFFSALLTCERGNTDKVAMIINELKQKKLIVLPPDVNNSDTSFKIEEISTQESGVRSQESEFSNQDTGFGRQDTGPGFILDTKYQIPNTTSPPPSAIRFGLSAIKNIGDGAVDGIVAERSSNGRFKDFLDFCQRVDHKCLNSRLVESLIKAGALSEFGSRSNLLKIAPEYLEAGAQHQKMQAIGQQSLFGLDEVVTSPPVGDRHACPLREDGGETDEAHESQILEWEKEVLGFYLTKHPHQDSMQKIYEIIPQRISELAEKQSGKEITLGGIVETKKVVLTKKNAQEMCFLNLNDLTGSIETIIFPKIYEAGGGKIIEDALLIIQGKLDTQDDGTFKLIANKVLIPETGIEESRS